MSNETVQAVVETPPAAKPDEDCIDVMVDLETLGRLAGCKVLSIGAATFTREGVGSRFYIAINREGQPGLMEDPDTVKWWSEQSAEARRAAFEDGDRRPLQEALGLFNEWLRSLRGIDEKGFARVNIWGNGSDFDNAILQTAYAAALAEGPAWPFWRNRCYRTLKNENRQIKLVRQGVHHHALSDAESQAAHAVAIRLHTGYWSAAPQE